MNIHPITTPTSPSLASPLFDASFDSIESLTTYFTASAAPAIETTNLTEVALGYHRNQQYSITAMTTSTGAVAERYAYTAYGQPTIASASGSVLTSSAVGNRYTYSGREWDETLGIHHFRARWMSPMTGRFLGRDPIGYVDGLNLYNSYFVPNKLDPNGNKWCWDDCEEGKTRNPSVTGFDLQRWDIGGDPASGDEAALNLAILEVLQKTTNLLNVGCATLTDDVLAAIMEAADALGIPSAGGMEQRIREIWQERCSRNRFDVVIWIQVSFECCKSRMWPLGTTWKPIKKWKRCDAGGIFTMPLNMGSERFRRAFEACKQSATDDLPCN
jgi:RHS repeat-associated protein